MSDNYSPDELAILKGMDPNVLAQMLALKDKANERNKQLAQAEALRGGPVDVQMGRPTILSRMQGQDEAEPPQQAAAETPADEGAEMQAPQRMEEDYPAPDVRSREMQELVRQKEAEAAVRRAALPKRGGASMPLAALLSALRGDG